MATTTWYCRLDGALRRIQILSLRYCEAMYVITLRMLMRLPVRKSPRILVRCVGSITRRSCSHSRCASGPVARCTFAHTASAASTAPPSRWNASMASSDAR